MSSSVIMSDTFISHVKPWTWQGFMAETMIHTLLNLCVGSVFALYDCLYYLMWPYQNVVHLIIISKCAFLMLLLNAFALLVHQPTFFSHCLWKLKISCQVSSHCNSWGFNMKKHYSCAFKRINVTGSLLPFVLFTYFVKRRYVIPTNLLSSLDHFLPDTKQNWAWNSFYSFYIPAGSYCTLKTLFLNDRFVVQGYSFLTQVWWTY